MVFPEGTNGNRKALLLFKPGAFIPGVPVQPVVFRFKMWDTITWTFDGQDIPLLVFLTLCGLYTHIEFQYLPVYYPNQREKRKKKFKYYIQHEYEHNNLLGCRPLIGNCFLYKYSLYSIIPGGQHL